MDFDQIFNSDCGRDRIKTKKSHCGRDRIKTKKSRRFRSISTNDLFKYFMNEDNYNNPLLQETRQQKSEDKEVMICSHKVHH